MDNEAPRLQAYAESRVVLAHDFFVQAIRDWISSAETQTSSTAEDRTTMLAEVLQQHLQIVAIDLSGTDDDQLIFETLYDRGTPLLVADLIKNYVFQQCDDIGADVDEWSERYWRESDSD